MITPRELARQQIEWVLAQDRSERTEKSGAELQQADGLGPEDYALFTELVQGVLREWRFLEWAVARHARRMPRGALRTLIYLAAYQLLFLDRVPDYSVYAEAKRMAQGLKVSPPETKFLHAVLKAIQREKDSLLTDRDHALEKCAQGQAPSDEFAWAVLNATPPLLDALTVVDVSASKKDSRPRAVKALTAMKRKPALVGYVLPGQIAESAHTTLSSEVAPNAEVFESGTALKSDLLNGRVRIQGEASQWACDVAAKWLVERAQSMPNDRPIRVLEMTTGKGGKLLGTLAAWTRLAGSATSLPAIEWIGADTSAAQLHLFCQDAVPLVERLWPQVRVTSLRQDWSATPSLGGFDFVWLDAPCTGLGTLAKNPEIALTRGDTAYEQAKKLSLLQKGLSRTAVSYLVDRGAFFYTVCTMTRPETHEVTRFVREQLKREVVFEKGLWPGSPPAPRAEGFYAALFA